MIIIYYLACIASIFLIYLSVYFIKKLVKRKSGMVCKHVAPIEAIDTKDKKLITVGQICEADDAHSKVCFEISNLMIRLCKILNNRVEEIKTKEFDLLPNGFTQKSIVKSNYDKKQLYELVKKIYEFIEIYPQERIVDPLEESRDTVLEEVKTTKNTKYTYANYVKAKKAIERYRKNSKSRYATSAVLEIPELKFEDYSKVLVAPKVGLKEYSRLIGKLIVYDDKTVIDLGKRVEVKKD